MKLTAGEIYFIKEHDVLTKIETSYVKIGLVKEDEEEKRSSTERALEHQTGNPRKLSIFHVLKTPLVSSVENKLHRYYAKNRISGEWFEMTPELLKVAIGQAAMFAEIAKKDFEVLSAADALDEQLSTESILEPTEILEGLRVSLLNSKLKLKTCEELDDAYRELVAAFAKTEPGSDHLATKVIKAPRREFNKEVFEKAYPELWSEFQTVSESISRKFTLVVRGHKAELQSIDYDLDAFKLHFESELISVKEKKHRIEDLQDLYFDLRILHSAISWDCEVLEAKLKVECGTAKEIRDICKWTRVMKKKTSFDKERLKSIYPDLWAEFTETVVVPDVYVPTKY